MELSEVEPTVAGAGDIFRRILVLIDYSMDCHRAFGVALELQRTHGSVVRVFHSAQSDGSDDWLGGIGSPAVGGDWVQESLGRLKRFLTNVAPACVPHVEMGARVGLPLMTLEAEIRDWEPTLVVAAARVHARFARSPAERMVHGTPVPTLIIPTGAH